MARIWRCFYTWSLVSQRLGQVWDDCPSTRVWKMYVHCLWLFIQKASCHTDSICTLYFLNRYSWQQDVAILLQLNKRKIHSSHRKGLGWSSLLWAKRTFWWQGVIVKLNIGAFFWQLETLLLYVDCLTFMPLLSHSYDIKLSECKHKINRTGGRWHPPPLYKNFDCCEINEFSSMGNEHD
jgi:hypothetical protein